MYKWELLSRISEAGIVAVVRASSAESALRIADACLDGGVTALEITFTVPDACDAIAGLAKRFSSGEIQLGAGTVLDGFESSGRRSGEIFESSANAAETVRQQQP